MATGLDEDYKKPKNLADQVVRLLDDDAVAMQDRIRLIIEYVMHRNGVFEMDIEKLLAHSQLPPQDNEIIRNLELLGARSLRPIKDTKPPPQVLFPKKPPPPAAVQEEISLSRFDPLIKPMLEEQLRGTLDQTVFPYLKPMLDANDALTNQLNMSQSSLRSAKPTWARTRPSAMEPRQRIFVFVAGGATYSESRACYEISKQFNRDVYLATTHMVTPNLFLRQVGDLSVDRRRLDLPLDRPPRKAPLHVFEKDLPVQSATQQLPTAGLANMTISSGNRPASAGAAGPPSNGTAETAAQRNSHFHLHSSSQGGKKSSKEPKEKKKGFFRF